MDLISIIMVLLLNSIVYYKNLPNAAAPIPAATFKPVTHQGESPGRFPPDAIIQD